MEYQTRTWHSDSYCVTCSTLIHNWNLLCLRRNDVESAAVVDHRVRGQAEPSRGSDQPRADVVEAVAIRSPGDRWIGGDIIGNHEVGAARRMHMQREHHRRRLRTFVDQFVADSNLHKESLIVEWSITVHDAPGWGVRNRRNTSVSLS